MHPGCNTGIRKEFLILISSSGTREYHSVDVIVHEFYKLFGCYGVSEYTINFLDFLDIMSDLPAADITYYKSCINVVLDHQIGSSYFVTAATIQVNFHTRKYSS